MKYCHKCGAPLADDADFCTQCGAKTEIRQEPDHSLRLKSKQSEQKKDKRLIILLLLVIVLLLGFAILGLLVFGNNSEAKLRRQLSLGERYYAELDYDRAIAAYSESLRIDPKNEEALIGIAHSYEDRGMERLQEEPGSEEGYSDLLTAVDYYKQAEEYHPDSERLPEIQEGIQRSGEAAASYSGNQDEPPEESAGTTATEQTEEQAEEELSVIEVGDTYIFGTYEQDNDTSNGAEDIEWIVLDKDGDRVLLISKYILDCQPYNTDRTEVTWETCSLRGWLNGTFMDTAFSEDEVRQIVTSDVSAETHPENNTDPGNDTRDQVFLLSLAEAETYFGSSEERTCEPTEYAIGKRVYTKDDHCDWWLRSPGYLRIRASYVNYDGSVNYIGNDVGYNRRGVRPALWITVTDRKKEEQPGIEVGDTYIFGTYEQDNDPSNGAEDIEWIVLDKDGERILLISRYVLDSKPYNTEDIDITWETCSLCEWLNRSFIETAFSADEVEQIVTSTVGTDRNPNYSADPGDDTRDHLFILSMLEAETYFGSSEERKCEPTAYAKGQGAYTDSEGCCAWWLRSSDIASIVYYEGSLIGYGKNFSYGRFGVRPSLWIEP